MASQGGNANPSRAIFGTPGVFFSTKAATPQPTASAPATSQSKPAAVSTPIPDPFTKPPSSASAGSSSGGGVGNVTISPLNTAADSVTITASVQQFRIAAQGYHNSSKYSDFTIKCSGKEFPVHRCFICVHSKWFERACSGMFKEAAAQSAELKDDNLRAVELMIHYFYKFDYDEFVGFGGIVATKEKDGADMDSLLELHAWVYATADKYEVLNLRALALEKFKKNAATLFTNAKAMVSAVRAIYNEIPLPAYDNTLREAILDAWVLGGRDLQVGAKDMFLDLVTDVPMFAADLADRLMGGFNPMVRHYCKSCGTILNPTRTMLMDVKCNKCNAEPKEIIHVLSTIAMKRWW